MVKRISRKRSKKYNKRNKTKRKRIKRSRNKRRTFNRKLIRGGAYNPPPIQESASAQTIPSRTKLQVAQVRLAFAKMLNSELFDGVDINIITNIVLLLNDEYLGYKINKYKMKWDAWASSIKHLISRDLVDNGLSVNLGEGDEIYNFTFDDFEIGNMYYYHSIGDSIESNGIIEISDITITQSDAYFLIIIRVEDINKNNPFDIIFSFCTRMAMQAYCTKRYQWNNYVSLDDGCMINIKKFKKFSSNEPEPSWYTNYWVRTDQVHVDENAF